MPRICLALLVMLIPASALAQADAMTELYGAAVHKYYNGDYAGAEQMLTTVVDSGSQDPRVYFFRGLAEEIQGRSGDSDFATGARLEAEGKLVVDVGFALSRVQGHLRGKIEAARRDARISVRQQQLVEQQARLKAAAEAPAMTPPATPPAVPADAVASDPFGGTADGSLRSDTATVDATQPTPAEVDATVNPFGDDPAPAAATPAPAAANPFGTPATSEPANPFGGDTPAPADPFGTTPGAADPGAADPFGTSPGAADPFGSPASGGSSDPFGL
jgi:hypothetical protein